ncbi:MAG: hypothetical protein HC900_12195 [Methylacidiphilales bacterium]|nr:hypothetical protein [Candidatus Methylacidiphilales bacterium]
MTTEYHYLSGGISASEADRSSASRRNSQQQNSPSDTFDATDPQMIPAVLGPNNTRISAQTASDWDIRATWRPPAIPFDRTLFRYIIFWLMGFFALATLSLFSNDTSPFIIKTIYSTLIVLGVLYPVLIALPAARNFSPIPYLLFFAISATSLRSPQRRSSASPRR